MFIYLDLLLAFFLSTAIPYLILGASLGQNYEMISLDAIKDTQNVPSEPLSLDTLQFKSSYYLFPFMRNLISEDNETFDRISLDDSSTTNSTEITNTDNASNTVKAISGRWAPVATGVQAGDNFSTLHNIIVRPVTFASTDLDIDTSFTIKSLDRDAPNYISIVYSWIDPQNYKYAGITFLDDQAFVDFGTVSNGNLSWDPLGQAQELI